MAFAQLVSKLFFGKNGSDVAVTDAEPLPIYGNVNNKDIYATGTTLADQSGNNGVLTFTFPSPIQLVYVFAKSSSGALQARADPFGGEPSVSQGVPCEDGVATPMLVQTSSIKVYAPIGMTVSVWGFRY